MTYSELKEIMHEYRQGRLSRDEMVIAIGLRQRGLCASDAYKS